MSTVRDILRVCVCRWRRLPDELADQLGREVQRRARDDDVDLVTERNVQRVFGLRSTLKEVL